jgi:hypothetical protein
VVSVRFTALGADRTRVVLTHSTWEAYGDLAGDMRGGYGSSWGDDLRGGLHAGVRRLNDLRLCKVPGGRLGQATA